MVRRYAFTMIELIFAIVIISITVISLPTMNQVIGKGIDSNLIQEAIFAASTELNEAVTAHWDENSVELGDPNSFARVIDSTIQVCGDDPLASNYRRMAGHINQPLHRRCLDSNATAPSDASATAVDSLDDMEHGYVNIFTDVAHATGYKRSYNSRVDVTRPAYFNDSNNSNMKKITIIVQENEEKKTVVKLVTYSANIGEIDYYKKEL